MRTSRYFAVWGEGQVIAVVLGYKEARKLSACRAYRSFNTQLAAEEFAMWWNHEVSVRYLAERRAEADATYLRARGSIPLAPVAAPFRLATPAAPAFRRVVFGPRMAG